MAKAGDGKQRSSKRRATERLTKRLTPQERVKFEKRARYAGFDSGQDYLTAFVIGDVRLHAAMRKDTTIALGHLGKIGSNINQIAKAANEGRIHHLDADAARALDDMRRALHAVGEKLRSALQ